ncbi:hypothetical protein AVEN_145735-1 [Araneus ventricosus]|uniref:Uncharacterized protein n=1 Tax=Araneus ventricosus TaxID=182803 RepID=A0A4Y2LJG6_ARAVE|nr:hypothetical protein AVEN_111930-1 [Araneus ventricosus]GBN14694.1 hypothetical protein AVEN_145735-1 [Araneus ventricosus]
MAGGRDVFETELDSTMSSVKSSQRPIKYFSLPDFSNVLQPLLNGDALSEKYHARLSSILKEELISFLNHENLISTGNTSTLRWEYRNLGETLVLKYPKMLWDLPSHRQKKFRKENSPIYSVFIRRLSERRKMQRLRAKKRKVDQFVVEVAEDNFEVSPEDSVSELKVSCYFNLPVTFSLKNVL